MKIEKVKNVIYLYTEECQKPYWFDINTGWLYGRSQKVLMNTPPKVNRLISMEKEANNVLFAMYYLRQNTGVRYSDMKRYAEIFQFADRLESIGYDTKAFCGGDLLEICEHANIIKEKNFFKVFAKAFLSNPSLRLYDFYIDYSKEKFFAQHNLIANEYLTQSMIDWIYYFIQNYPYYENYIKYIKYYFTRGLYKFFEHNDYYITRYLDNYFNMCTRMEVTPKKDNFMRAYVELTYMYETQRVKWDDEALYKNQLQHKNALSFENDKYKVIIPTTTQEFIDEANSQSNCVARTYLPKVVDNITNIVFIRKKDNLDKSYITCEVREGRIWQYLLSCNKSPTETDDYDFRIEYQKHLEELWNK